MTTRMPLRLRRVEILFSINEHQWKQKKKITLKCMPDDIDVNSLGYLVPQALKLLLHDVT